jgi:hypothetical protein
MSTLNPNNAVILCLVAFTTGLYAFVFAKIGALVYLSISRDVTTLNICDGAHGAITVANNHSKSKRESNLLWQYYSIEFPAHRTEFIS